jgi:hypothetical protein
MIYNHFFSAALARLHEERRYRVFADLERIAGRFPHATWHSLEGPRPLDRGIAHGWLLLHESRTLEIHTSGRAPVRMTCQRGSQCASK